MHPQFHPSLKIRKIKTKLKRTNQGRLLESIDNLIAYPGLKGKIHLPLETTEIGMNLREQALLTN